MNFSGIELVLLLYWVKISSNKELGNLTNNCLILKLRLFESNVVVLLKLNYLNQMSPIYSYNSFPSILGRLPISRCRGNGVIRW
jgi:hypothetical protein